MWQAWSTAFLDLPHVTLTGHCADPDMLRTEPGCTFTTPPKMHRPVPDTIGGGHMPHVRIAYRRPAVRHVTAQSHFPHTRLHTVDDPSANTSRDAPAWHITVSGTSAKRLAHSEPPDRCTASRSAITSSGVSQIRTGTHPAPRHVTSRDAIRDRSISVIECHQCDGDEDCRTDQKRQHQRSTKCE